MQENEDPLEEEEITQEEALKEVTTLHEEGLVQRELSVQEEIEQLVEENQVTEESWRRDLGYPTAKDEYADLSDVEEEYYSKVQDAVDYERRKQRIKDERHKLKAKVELDARTHDLRQKLKRVFKH